MKRFILLIPILLWLQSCTDTNLDFDQADHLTIMPVFEGDILYFDLQKPNLTDQNGQFRAVISDTVDFGIFEDGKVRDGFIKAEIAVAYNNTFERRFDSHFYFIDDNNQPVDQSGFIIAPATPPQTQVAGDTLFVFDANNNPEFVNFRKIVMEVEISPDQLPVEDKTLHVQVKGTFYTHIVIE